MKPPTRGGLRPKRNQGKNYIITDKRYLSISTILYLDKYIYMVLSSSDASLSVLSLCPETKEIKEVNVLKSLDSIYLSLSCMIMDNDIVWVAAGSTNGSIYIYDISSLLKKYLIY